ncbi:EamA family transporter, partial [Pseudoalteromonas sp. S4492]
MVESQLSTTGLTAIQSGVVGGGSLLLLMITGQTIELPSSSEFWMITLYLVLFCTIFAFFAQNFAVRKT